MPGLVTSASRSSWTGLYLAPLASGVKPSRVPPQTINSEPDQTAVKSRRGEGAPIMTHVRPCAGARVVTTPGTVRSPLIVPPQNSISGTGPDRRMIPAGLSSVKIASAQWTRWSWRLCSDRGGIAVNESVAHRQHFTGNGQPGALWRILRPGRIRGGDLGTPAGGGRKKFSIGRKSSESGMAAPNDHVGAGPDGEVTSARGWWCSVHGAPTIGGGIVAGHLWIRHHRRIYRPTQSFLNRSK